MDLKYDIYTIKNSQGTGENRQYDDSAVSVPHVAL